MNEVEKMYENAGVKYYKEICAIKNVIDKVGNKECYFEVCCSSCPLNKTSFTAEKQLSLIKWLGDTDYYIHSIYKTIDTKEYCIENDFYDIQTNKFEEALARLINKLWRDLTKAEQGEIKEILE
jgi:hypothetical protein